MASGPNMAAEADPDNPEKNAANPAGGPPGSVRYGRVEFGIELTGHADVAAC